MIASRRHARFSPRALAADQADEDTRARRGGEGGGGDCRLRGADRHLGPERHGVLAKSNKEEFVRVSVATTVGVLLPRQL